MTVRTAWYTASLAWLALGASSLPAAEPAQPDPADVDFQIQGEYQGDRPFPGLKHPPGIQVIARGKGKQDHGNEVRYRNVWVVERK